MFNVKIVSVAVWTRHSVHLLECSQLHRHPVGCWRTNWFTDSRQRLNEYTPGRREWSPAEIDDYRSVDSVIRRMTRVYWLSESLSRHEWLTCGTCQALRRWTHCGKTHPMTTRHNITHRPLSHLGRSSNCVIMPNFVEIAGTAADIWPFFDFSRWRRSAILDLL